MNAHTRMNVNDRGLVLNLLDNNENCDEYN